jgi:multidrug efflux pump subunit AcrB
MAESARESLDSLANLMLPLPDAPFIRLNEVATLESEPGLSSYFHFDYTRTITVTADVVKTLTTPLKAIEQLKSGIDLKRDWPGMRIVVGGEAEETESSMGSLIVAFTAAAIGIYLLLYLLFNSFLQPLSVLIAVPFSLIGVIIAFALHHQPLGFLAMLGVVGLSGIVVNDSLILVDVINKLKADQPGDPWPAAIAEAVGKRLRPILLTSVTTVAGLLPMAYGIGGSDPYTAPMALAMGYGLLFSTVLTLIFLPCLVMVGVDLQSFGGVLGRLFVKKRRG